jgi:hypothetical protein
VVHEFVLDEIEIGLLPMSLACALERGTGSYAAGYLKNARTAIADIRRNAQTNRPVRHVRRRSPVGRQLNIAFPGRGFSVGRRRVPQSSLARVRFSQKTFITSSMLASEGALAASAASCPGDG